jgi:hypothetical protein
MKRIMKSFSGKTPPRGFVLLVDTNVRVERKALKYKFEEDFR